MKLGVSDSVVGLVLPTAYSFNHDGTCLFFAASSVFLAQATDVHLGFTGQLTLMIVLLLTSKGGAGVAGSSIPILALTLAATIVVGKWEKAIDWEQMRRELNAGYVAAAPEPVKASALESA